jgi:hypothetical protein
LVDDDPNGIPSEYAVGYSLSKIGARAIADRIGPPPEDLAIEPDGSELPEHLGAAFREDRNLLVN